MNKNKNTIMLTHNDLDGISCVILAKNFFRNLVVKRISYNKILSTLEEIVEELSETRDTPQLFITDLKLAQVDIEYLYNHSEVFSKVVIIDHHLYETEFPTKENFKVIINQKYSACALTYAYLKDQCDLSNYKKFVSLVNTYDLWIKESSDFIEAKSLNRLFWNMGYKNFEKRFFFTPRITESLRAELIKLENDIKEYFERCLKNKIIQTQDDVTIALCDKHIGELKDFFNTKVIINLRNNYHFSIRVCDSLSEEDVSTIRDAILNEVSDDLCINKGGHLHAFGITTRELTILEAQYETQKLANKALKILEQIKRKQK